MKFFNYFTEKEVERYGDKRIIQEPNVVKMIIHGVVLLFAIIIALNSWTTVGAGQVKVKTLFGKVDDTELTEGFHVVNPLAKFTNYDTRDNTLEINNIMVPSQDKLKTDMDISIIYSMEPSAASEMKSEIGDLKDVERKFLITKARSLVREVGKGVERSQDFFLDNVQVEMQQEALEKLSAFMLPKGVVIESVLFRDVTLPKVISNAIIQTKQRQEEIQQETAKLKIKEQQAEQLVVEAAAQSKAAKEDAERKRTIADADAYQIIALAKATGDGNKLINKSLTKDLIEYKRVETWDGKYPTTMAGQGTGLLLNIGNK